MSVITETVDCPQCGLPAQKDEYYVIGEERVICNWCGYNHLKTTEGTESHKGYGSIRYITKEENGSNESSEKIIRLKSPLDIVHRHEVIMDIQENFDNDKSSFFVWSEEDKKLECLIGNRPKTLEEVYQEQRQEADYYRQIGFGSRPINDKGIDF